MIHNILCCHLKNSIRTETFFTLVIKFHSLRLNLAFSAYVWKYNEENIYSINWLSYFCLAH